MSAAKRRLLSAAAKKRQRKGLTLAGKGRTKGVPNKISRAAKEAFQHAFEGLGGIQGLIRWGQKNRTEFYKLYARLLPIEATGAMINFNLPAPGSVITDAGEAAALYAAIVGRPDAAIPRLTFAAAAADQPAPICSPAQSESNPRVEPKPDPAPATWSVLGGDGGAK